VSLCRCSGAPHYQAWSRRDAGLTMAYKLLDAAEDRWRSVNAPHLVALVRASVTFVDGIKIECEDQGNAA